MLLEELREPLFTLLSYFLGWWLYWRRLKAPVFFTGRGDGLDVRPQLLKAGYHPRSPHSSPEKIETVREFGQAQPSSAAPHYHVTIILDTLKNHICNWECSGPHTRTLDILAACWSLQTMVHTRMLKERSEVWTIMVRRTYQQERPDRYEF